MLAGSACADIPEQTLTVQYVFDNCAAAVQSITLDDIQVNDTALRNVSLAAYVLSFTPASRLPSPCSYLTGQPATCANNDLTHTSLLDLELQGDNLAAYYTAVTINLNGLDLSNSLLPPVWLADIGLSDTPLGAITVGSLAHAATFVNCGASPCAANLTLGPGAGQQPVGRWRTRRRRAVCWRTRRRRSGTLPLASLLVGLIPRGALPFEQLPTNDILASSPAAGDRERRLHDRLRHGVQRGDGSRRPAEPSRRVPHCAEHRHHDRRHRSRRR